MRKRCLIRRYFLIEDLRFTPPIRYNQYKGWKFGRKPRKGLRLLVGSLDKQGMPIIKKKGQCVRIKGGRVVPGTKKI